jgi:alpha-beta hydrolase superfamily lysophospholipase
VSTLLDKLSFGSYNKPYSGPEATGFEWLCSDQEQVRLYVEDPACGFVSRSGLYRDLFGALKVINGESCFRSTPDELPLLIFSGDDDPVGGKKGDGVRRVAESYKRHGSRDLTLVLKEGQRHECLNEPGKVNLHRDIFDWLTARIEG